MAGAKRQARARILPEAGSDPQWQLPYPGKDPEVGPITGWPPHKNVEESKNVITYDINSEKLTEEQKEVPRIWNDLSTNE